MLHIVWLKRDLRLNDHAPLAFAASRGPLLMLYVVEPEVFEAPDFAPQHWASFVNPCLSCEIICNHIG